MKKPLPSFLLQLVLSAFTALLLAAPGLASPDPSFRSLGGEVILAPSSTHFTLAAAPAAGDAEVEHALRSAIEGAGAKYDILVRTEARRTWLVALEDTGPGTATLDATLGALRSRPEVAWVLPAVHTPDGGVLGLLPEVMALAHGPEASAALAHHAGTVGLRQLAPMPGTHGGLFAVQDATPAGIFAAARALRSHAGAIDAHPNFLRPKSARLSTNDPYLSQQWYLTRVKAQTAWDTTMGSSSVIVAVIDDGFDMGHEDLVAAGKIVSPFDFDGNDSNPQASSNDAHGTAVAGIAIALGNNGKGIAGVCPGCRFMPVRQGYTDYDDVAAFNHVASNGAHVVNNSWGYYYPSTSVKNALQNAVAQGRGGLGTLVLFASGNDGIDIDQAQDISAVPGVVAVGATSYADGYSGYSNYGASLDVSAPADGQVTTDLTSGGYGQGAYTSSFGGTSGACPVVAGVAGLAFSMAPGATEAYLRSILFSTADKVGSGYGGQGKSLYFGYGRVNAAKAVAAVESAGESGGGTGPPDAGGTGTEIPVGTGSCADFFACAEGCSTDACVEACAAATSDEALAAAAATVECLDAAGCYDAASQAEFETCALAACEGELLACFEPTPPANSEGENPGGDPSEDPDNTSDPPANGSPPPREDVAPDVPEEPEGTGDCGAFLTCIGDCTSQACIDSCADETTASALTSAAALIDCLDEAECYEVATEAAFASCSKAACSDELDACVPSGGGLLGREGSEDSPPDSPAPDSPDPPASGGASAPSPPNDGEGIAVGGLPVPSESEASPGNEPDAIAEQGGGCTAASRQSPIGAALLLAALLIVLAPWRILRN